MEGLAEICMWQKVNMHLWRVPSIYGKARRPVITGKQAWAPWSDPESEVSAAD